MPLERIEENFEGPSWSNRIFFYFCLFSFLLIIFLLVFIGLAAIYPDFAIPNGPHYNTTELRNMGFFDNERYLISALVQSLAATIALVITLSLVAVQLAAQSYSARVIDVYKNNPDMWILLSIYIVVIFYGLGLLKVIDVGVAGINMEFTIFAAYFLGFFAFVCLVPYILNTLDLLKPSTVIEISAEKITKDNVLTALNNNEVIDEIDPVQPIIDIINSALEKNDYETVRNGLKAITKSTVSILKKSHFEKGEGKAFSRYIIDAVNNIAIFAIRKENENSTLSVIHNLEIIGTKAAEQKLEAAALEAAKALGNVGAKAAEQKLEAATWKTAKALENVGTETVKQKLELASRLAAIALGNVGTKAAEQKFEGTTWEVAKALGNIGTKAAEQKLEAATWEVAKALGNVGTKAVEEKLELESEETIDSLRDVGTKATEQKFELAASEATKALGNIGIKAAEQKHEITAWKATNALEIVGIKTVEQKLEIGKTEAYVTFIELLKRVEDNKWDKLSNNIKEILEKIKYV